MRRSQQEYKAARHAGRVRILNEIKIERGCIDCGYAEHPVALQFDHRDPSAKSWGISSNVAREWPQVMAEIAKCDVRCANCHAVRTNTVDGASGRRTPGGQRRFRLADVEKLIKEQEPAGEAVA